MNLSKTIKPIILLSAISLLIAANAVMAQPGTNIPGINPIGPSSVSGIFDVIRNIVRWIYILFFIMTVVFLLFAAFTYLTAQGDPEKVGKAKTQIIYAAVAVVVALLAISFERIIANFLQTGQ